MEKLLEFIVKSIVQKPEKIKIKKETLPADGQEGENLISFNLKVDPEDLKIVIGKGGKTIKAIRNLLRLRAFKEGKRVNLELQES